MSMPLTPNESPVEVARGIIDANQYMTLATADLQGRPWATPVWFAQRELREFFWVSRSERRHSENVAATGRVALVVFDSTTPVGSGAGVYAEGWAALVTDSELADALSVFNAKSEASALPTWSASKVSHDAPFSLYRMVASQVWVLDEHEDRIPVRE